MFRIPQKLSVFHYSRASEALVPSLPRNKWATSWENLFMPYVNNICTVWSASLLFPAWIVYLYLLYSRNFKTLASLCTWADQFESYLVANPKTGFVVTWLKCNYSTCSSQTLGVGGGAGGGGRWGLILKKTKKKCEMSHVMRKPPLSLGVWDQVRLKPACSAIETS